MDFNRDGRLSQYDLEQATNNTWMPTDRIMKWFTDLDIDGDKVLTRSDGLLLQKRLKMEVKRCADEAIQEFERIDLDSDGNVTVGELMTFLAKFDGTTKTLVETRFGENDLNGDGKIILNEYVSHQMTARCF
uniref:EF-hand domain-containing protein n=1 Tax=Plectus sambesii TaxID=2011161 RepID=A0A914XGT1_9BILA